MERARTIILRTLVVLLPLGLLLTYLALTPGSWAEARIASTWYILHQLTHPLFLSLASLSLVAALALMTTRFLAQRRFTRALREGSVPARHSGERSEDALVRRAHDTLDPLLSGPRPSLTRLIDALLCTLVDLGAIEITLHPGAQTVEISLRFAMTPLPIAAMTHKTFAALLDRLRLIVGIDGHGQGTIEFRGGIATEWIDIAFEPPPSPQSSASLTSEGTHGETSTHPRHDLPQTRVRLTLPHRAIHARSLDDLHLSSEVSSHLKRALEKTHGLILVGGHGHLGSAGEDHAGLTTTLYAAAHHIHTMRPGLQTIASLEPHIRLDLPFMTQVEIGAATPSAVLRTTLGDPHEVIFIHHLADAATANLAVQAAKKRLVIASLETDGALGALATMLRLADAKLVAKTFLLAQGQALIPLLCPNCRRPTAPSVSEARHFSGLDIPQEVSHATGCDQCANRGTLKTHAIIAWTIDRAPWLMPLLDHPRSARELQREAQKAHYRGPLESALELISRGDVDIEEAIAITRPWGSP